MSHYHHITPEEREKIFFFKAKDFSITQIAKETGRSKSTISRELKRNTFEKQYSPLEAQKAYRQRRRRCRPKRKILKDFGLFLKICDRFIIDQWSPEQIAERMRLEGYETGISYSSIYRAIYAGYFDEQLHLLSGKVRKGRRFLRRKGKKIKGNNDPRGRYPMSHHISERPAEANNRERIGDWEGDTVMGTKKKNSPCLATYVDRRSRFLSSAKAASKDAASVNEATIKCLQNYPVRTITVDRGAEFKKHHEVTEILSAEYYFPDPASPWERGTNENTNGLLREYFPKGIDFKKISDEQIQEVVDKLNHRPRKCLGYRTPYEVFFGVVLHLV